MKSEQGINESPGERKYLVEQETEPNSNRRRLQNLQSSNHFRHNDMISTSGKRSIRQ